MGIEIVSILGTVSFILDEAADADVGVPVEGMQSLHVEKDTLEDLPIADADDGANIDTESIYQQNVFGLIHEDDVNGHAAVSVTVTPTSIVDLPDGVVSARNITHRAESHDANVTFGFSLYVYYHYVKLSLAEMGLFLSRRM